MLPEILVSALFICTLDNSFFVGMNNETKTFVIHKDKDHSIQLELFLKTCKRLIGYNNIAFDYPIIHYFLDSIDHWNEGYFTSEEICLLLYEKAQSLIEQQNKGFGRCSQRKC